MRSDPPSDVAVELRELAVATTARSGDAFLERVDKAVFAARRGDDIGVDLLLFVAVWLLFKDDVAMSLSSLSCICGALRRATSVETILGTLLLLFSDGFSPLGVPIIRARRPITVESEHIDSIRPAPMRW
jgi:hypothetical protein